MCDGAKMDLKYFLLEKSLKKFKMDHQYGVSIALCMSRIPTNSLNHMYYEANCTSVYMSIEYTHFELQQVIPRPE